MKADTLNFKNPFIILPAELVEKSNAKALRFAIGRQIGHIKCDHIFYRALSSGGLESLEFVFGKWVQELIKSFFGKISDLILVDWVLASEISADRAGLIACQDMQTAQKALLNFTLAVPIEVVELNVEDYLEQAKVIKEKQKVVLENLPKSVQKGIGRWQRSDRLASDHPFISQRMKALQEYAECKAYRKLLE
jgi:Zn-dependent protease with chaperone function